MTWPRKLPAVVSYDVFHRRAWGFDIVLYLLFKEVSGGAFFATLLFWKAGRHDPLFRWAGPLLAAACLGLTLLILTLDLEQPKRFYYILTKPNFRSWMVWGTYFITAYAVVLGLWILAELGEAPGLQAALWFPGLIFALLSTIYTGFLFGQASARDLWLGSPHTLDLAAQAAIGGPAVLLVLGQFLGTPAGILRSLGQVVIWGMAVHLIIIIFECLVQESPTRHHERATLLISEGPFKGLFWGGAVLGGGLLPIVLLAFGGVGGLSSLAAILALLGSLAWEYIWVYAGQAVPIS
jgi:formate-dependent nitrite reductase membrane component NrfD